MRISTELDDVGYNPDTRGYVVFVDGIEEKYCLTADEELGYVKCVSEVKEDEFETIEKFGKVEIKMKKSIEPEIDLLDQLERILNKAIECKDIDIIQMYIMSAQSKIDLLRPLIEELIEAEL